MRFLRPETTLVWFAFFIKALGWEFIAKSDPEMNKVSDSMQP